MSYKDLYLEITGTFPDLPLAQAKRFINRAQRDAFDAWNWSFLAGDGVLNIPNSLNTGTVSATQNSPIITADSTAAAVWQTLGLFVPITQRSIKIGTDLPYNILAFDGVDTVYVDRPYTAPTTGIAATATINVTPQPNNGEQLTVGGLPPAPAHVFTFVPGAPGANQIQIGGSLAATRTNIINAINAATAACACTAAASTGNLIALTANVKGPNGNNIILGADVLITTPFTGGSDADANISYLLYRPYYAAPADFQRWVSVVDTNDSWNLIPGKKKEWIDWIDPQRSSIGGPAQFIAFYKFQRAQTIPPFGANINSVTTEPQQLFELWPAPTAQMSLSVYYKKRGLDLNADSDTSPFDDGLIISRALYHAYRFVQANQVRFAKTVGQRVNWAEMKKDANVDYMYELSNAVKRDDNINAASIIRPRGNWFPSSSWLQRHLTWGEYSNAYASSYNF